MEVGKITLDGWVIEGTYFFCYLGSIIQKDGELDGDVSRRIKSRWLKLKSTTRFLRVFMLSWGKENQTYKCCVVKQCHIHKINVATMRIFCSMCGVIRKDLLKNGVVRKKVGLHRLRIRQGRID